ncbi:DbpA/DbpB family decorin-binding adhesin [Borrelia sp. RT5S]|uniref:DbpA/DbpB family decorin-binding adhesin n=1 Tax=Borrelia sp. RT5S TaxID=2898581 RepID=UPI001E41AC5A|nr:DbpA/DbpB family decorin-binding adhesin [Borrelia sp. RT5S]UGQ16605.1 hypothetical protein LSO06_04655 [Borrelia sp. RT5S]
MSNVLKIVILVLLTSCSMLPSHLKTKVDNSSSAAKNQIDDIVKNSGFTFDNLQKATGTKGAGDDRIREVKLRVIEVGEEFLALMKDTIEELGEKGSGTQFAEIYSVILGVAESMERIGIQKAADTVRKAVDGGGPADSYEKIVSVHSAFLAKLNSVKEKQRRAETKNSSE